MFQKCPVCNGEGILPGYGNLSTSSCPTCCPTCRGTRIISTLNGLPPASSPASHSTSNTTNYKGTDFRDAHMESQSEYFGKK